MRTTLFVSSLLVATLASAPHALACTCAKFVPPDGITEGTEAVFEGTVVGIAMHGEYERIVTFEVLQSWAGVESPTMQVVTGLGGGDCGYEFEQDETYVVFAHARGVGGPPGVNICGGTQPTSAVQLERLGEPLWSAESQPAQELPDQAPQGSEAEATGADGADDELAHDVDAIEGSAQAPHAPSPPKPPSGGSAKKGGGCSVSVEGAHTGTLAAALALALAALVRRWRRAR